jgi:hypothetical protein
MPIIRQYVPFTTARRQRLFNIGLQNLANDADALCQMEWQDGKETLHKAEWDQDLEGWELVDVDKRVLPRGRGGDPKLLYGVPVIRAYSEEAAPISTEAALLARALEEEEYVEADEDGHPTEPVARDEPGEDVVDATDPDAVADGGTLTSARSTANRVPNFPAAGQTWDAVEYSLRDAAEYDPNPVNEADARKAAEWAELSAWDSSEILRYIMYGAGGAVGILALFVILIWFLGQIGDGSTGIQLTTGPVAGMLAALARPLVGDNGGSS